MGIIRMISLETIFFTYHLKYNSLVSPDEPVSSIPALLEPQMRLLVYFSPAAVSILTNFAMLAKNGNLKKTLRVIKTYPQILLSPGFTPFFFKWQKVYDVDSTSAQLQNNNVDSPESDVTLQLTICKQTSFLNAIAIGCAPQVALIVSLISRNVYKWDLKDHITSYQRIVIHTNTIFQILTT